MLTTDELLMTPEKAMTEALLREKSRLRLKFPTKRMAEAFRVRCYHLRRLDRKRNLEVLKEEASEFDLLQLHVDNEILVIQVPHIEVLVEP